MSMYLLQTFKTTMYVTVSCEVYVLYIRYIWHLNMLYTFEWWCYSFLPYRDEMDKQ